MKKHTTLIGIVTLAIAVLTSVLGYLNVGGADAVGVGVDDAEKDVDASGTSE